MKKWVKMGKEKTTFYKINIKIMLKKKKNRHKMHSFLSFCGLLVSLVTLKSRHLRFNLCFAVLETV